MIGGGGGGGGLSCLLSTYFWTVGDRDFKNFMDFKNKLCVSAHLLMENRVGR